jgi:hypothetical protein
MRVTKPSQRPETPRPLNDDKSITILTKYNRMQQTTMQRDESSENLVLPVVLTATRVEVDFRKVDHIRGARHQGLSVLGHE